MSNQNRKNEPLTSMPSILETGDPRKKMYDKIAQVHRSFTEAKWRSRQTKTPMSIDPRIVIHLEEVVAFLAQELLSLQVQVEKTDACSPESESCPPD